MEQKKEEQGLAQEAFAAFLHAYRPERTETARLEIHRSTREVCNILSDTLDVSPTDMAEMLRSAGFRLCIDTDGRVKWKIFKDTTVEEDE